MLWGDWRKKQAWRDRLERRATHKALDIPDDMGDINANKTYLGIGWKEILAAGALMGGGAYMLKDDAPEPAPAPVVQPSEPVAPPAFNDTDTIGFLEVDR